MSTKVSLPNGCYRSRLSVYPKNWEAKNASLNKPWYINYRFYDPEHPKPKQKSIRGMNEFKALKERQAATRELIDNEINLLHNHGYNPFTGNCITFEEGELSPDTPFLEALKAAQKSVKVGKYTKRDLNDVINGITKSARKLRIDKMPISTVSRKYIKRLLNDCCQTNIKFNKYRSNLKILFKELIEMEATENEPTAAIKKLKVFKKMRITLTRKERKQVSDHLYKEKYHFWRFTHIFFHSGSRESEMMLLRYEDIDLPNQRFKVVVQKDGEIREDWRTIKNVILPLWQEVMKEAKPGQYLFAKFMKPGDVPVNPDRISRYWKRYVKAEPPKGLNIKADFYSLKHSNLDEIADLLSVKESSHAAGHKSESTTRMYYLTNERKREHERLKDVDNSFA